MSDGLDLLNQFWLATEKEKHLSVYKSLIRRARPYTLDDDATELVQELASGPTIGDKLAIYRRLSRLPFDVIWLEVPYAARHRKRRELGAMAVEQSGARVPASDDPLEGTPERQGWLMQRLSETVWRATTVVSYELEKGLTVDTFAIDQVMATEGPVPFYSHVKDPVMKQVIIDLNKLPELTARLWGFFVDPDGTGRVSAAAVPDHLHKSNAFDLAPSWEGIMDRLSDGMPSQKQKHVSSHVAVSVTELAGDLRFLVAALATINQVPTIFENTQPKGSARVAGGMKPYMVNRIVRIGIPKARGRVRKILAMLKLAERAMRRHEVSGHWKTVRKDGQKELRWVKEYMRGDAELGYVQQIRQVEAQ